jgi:hypothetical protein
MRIASAACAIVSPTALSVLTACPANSAACLRRGVRQCDVTCGIQCACGVHRTCGGRGRRHACDSTHAQTAAQPMSSRLSCVHCERDDRGMLRSQVQCAACQLCVARGIVALRVVVAAAIRRVARDELLVVERTPDTTERHDSHRPCAVRTGPPRATHAYNMLTTEHGYSPALDIRAVLGEPLSDLPLRKRQHATWHAKDNTPRGMRKTTRHVACKRQHATWHAKDNTPRGIRKTTRHVACMKQHPSQYAKENTPRDV